MVDDGSKQHTIWFLPKFYFRVRFGSFPTEVAFQGVSGLEAEPQVIEYRHQDSPTFSTMKMPGIKKFSSVTMKKGVFKKDHDFWDWYNQIKMNTIQQETVTIELLDENGDATMTWTLQRAFPTKITSTDLKSEGNEVAVETLEIVYEGLTIAQG